MLFIVSVLFIIPFVVINNNLHFHISLYKKSMVLRRKSAPTCHKNSSILQELYLFLCILSTMLIAYLSTLRIRGPPQYQAYVLAVFHKAQHDLTSVSLSLTSFPIALSSITVVYLLFLEGTRHKAHSHFTILHWMLLLLRSLCSVATFSMRLHI